MHRDPYNGGSLMFAQMKSREHVYEPCPCNGSCDCHRPSKSEWVPVVVGLIMLVALPLTIVALFHGPNVRTIDVRGETCEIKFIQTGITSTGSPTGHDTVVCPSWSK